MGRPPKPTAVLELVGAYTKDPQRRKARAAEPRPNGPVGAPPAHWRKASSYPTGALAKIWREYQREIPPGILTLADRKVLEVLCVLTFESRRTGTKGAMRAGVEVAKLSAKFGMNPTDRARMSVPQAATPIPGKLSGFLDRKKTG